MHPLARFQLYFHITITTNSITYAGAPPSFSFCFWLIYYTVRTLHLPPTHFPVGSCPMPTRGAANAAGAARRRRRGGRRRLQALRGYCKAVKAVVGGEFHASWFARPRSPREYFSGELVRRSKLRRATPSPLPAISLRHLSCRRHVLPWRARATIPPRRRVAPLPPTIRPAARR